MQPVFLFNRKFLRNFLLNKNLSEGCAARGREVCLATPLAREGAVALRMRYTKYSYNLMINLLYLVVLLLIATAPFYYFFFLIIYIILDMAGTSTAINITSIRKLIPIKAVKKKTIVLFAPAEAAVSLINL